MLAGDHQHAADIARTITTPNSQADTLTLVAEVLVRTGGHQYAAEIARSITNSYWQASALVRVVGALA